MHLLALILSLMQIAPEIATEVLQVVAHAKGTTVPPTAAAMIAKPAPGK